MRSTLRRRIGIFSPEERKNTVRTKETTPESLGDHHEPTRAHEIEPYDLYSDDLPEDGKLPSDIEDAFKELNEVIRESKTILSWSPGSLRRQEEEEMNG